MIASGSPKRIESRPAGRFAVLAQAVARWSNAHPVLLFAGLTAWYTCLVWKPAGRPLWFDELFTYYIAQQPTVARMLEAIRTIDLNPPLSYCLTRWSIAAFGPSAWAARVPALLGFWGGSAAIFALLRRRAGALIAAIGVVLLWSSAYFSYAAEARPYGLLLGLIAILLAGWEAAARGCRRRLGLAVVAIAGTLLLLSHVFGLLSLGAVWAGEALRSARRRKIDWPMWVALLLPLIGVATYRPMFQSFGATMFPPEAQVTWGKLWFLYFAIFRWMWRPLLAIALVAWFLRSKDSDLPAESTPETNTVLALLFLLPVGLTLVFLRSHGAFYERYGMAAVLPIVLVTPMLLRRWTRANPTAAFAGFLSVVSLLLLSTSLRPPLAQAAAAALPRHAATKLMGVLATSPHGPFRPWWKPLPVPAQLLKEREQAPRLTSLDEFHPDLPLVAASELTFIEMDHRESAALTQRLFYLSDREAEIEISHRSVTDGLIKVERYFPVRGKIVPYNAFLRSSGCRAFLVIGLYEHPGDWLLRKLERDGAEIHIVAHYDGYADTDIYLVKRGTGLDCTPQK